MKSKLLSLLIAVGLLWTAGVQAAAPLRVFIRGGKKTHPPGAHEHEQFLNDWKKLLAERGMNVDGAMDFPTDSQLANTDVLLIHSQEGGDFPENQRPALEAFLKRGGGLLLIHASAAPSKQPGRSEYLKSIVGGAWVWGQTKWLEGPMSLYYVDRTHPITKDVANFDLHDEIYYDLDLDPAIQVLAASYTPNLSGARKNDPRGQPDKGRVTVYDIAPQIWTFEKTLAGGQLYRAFVSIPGHLYKNFDLPHYRAVLLRGIAWTGKRSNVDEFCQKEELASLRYPTGGPSRPEKSLAEMVVHPDFKVSLVATEPLINKPMNIDWDAQGRMWVAETPEYPDGRSANDRSDLVQRWVPEAKIDPATGLYDRPAYDKISILRDTDGDGVMDQKQIFYEGLERVTSLVLYRDGCIVSQAPDILRLRDTNGDGKADKVEKLYTGLGTRDTHAVINNVRWGFDGWIYATHGYSSSAHVTNGDGSLDFGNIGSGVVRFKPDGSAFEQYSSKGGNTWGLDISWDNEVFWTQPTSGDLVMHVVLSEDRLSRGRLPGLTGYQIVQKSIPVFPLIPYDQLPYVQIDQVGRFTAAAGTVIYDGGAWPAAWNYSYFTTEPTVNLVYHALVKTAGVTYTADRAPGRETVEFIVGKDWWFRPIEVRTGPDGAVYMIDFYNQAVIHNDTRGPKHGPRNAAIRPDRDHYYGRIYRIDHKQAKTLTVPNLAKAGGADLVKALEHPNQHTRMNALRLLAEKGAAQGAADILPAELTSLKALATSQKPAQARVAALWALAQLGRIDAATLNTAANDANEALRKNAMMIAAARPTVADTARSAAVKLLNDPNPQVRLQALLALAGASLDAEVARALVTVYPKLDDNWSRSAFLGAAAKSPATVLDAALAASAVNGELVSQLTGLLVSAQNANEAAKLVISLAARPAALDTAKRAAVERLAAGLRPDVIPAWNADLERALRTLLTSSDAGLPAATLPLVARWDKQGALAADLKTVLQRLLAQLSNAQQPDDARATVVNSLLGVRKTNPDILPTVAKLLGSDASTDLQRRVLENLGSLPDDAVGGQIVGAFARLNAELQAAALNQLLRRALWSMTLLDALDAGRIDPQLLGPANVHRLRLHPNAKVAARANALIDKLRGPEAKEKAALIAKLTPEVEKTGNPAKGRELYTANCATCHQLGDTGNPVGPPLNGMGAHGPATLLGHILDPNRELDFSFAAWSIETKDGEIYDGVVTRENKDVVVLRNAAGEKEIPKNTIKSRRNTGRSLMPEGFESLGAEGLRDLLTFLCAGESRFRFIDLSGAVTADSRKGIYRSLESTGESLRFLKSGAVHVEGVPFNVINPARHPFGRNVMVLKGGGGLAKQEMPQKVEARVGFAAKQLHFLGNVAGWGYPLGGGKVPALKATVHYAGGATEEILFTNGVEFADYIREIEVPGSKLARDIVGDGKQVRVASRKLKGAGVIEKLTFESFDNGLAPTTVAVTADLSSDPLPAAPATATPQPAPKPADGKGKKAAAKAAPVRVASAVPTAVAASTAPMRWGAGTKVLLVGGGNSHDYEKWFNQADSATLKAAGCSVNYTEDGEVTARELSKVDVAVLSVNRKEWATPALRKALFDFASAGKGLILLHPGLWYNFADWPDYNRVLAGGGARGHDKLGEFTINVLRKDHPITKGVTASFKIIDELYYMKADPKGTTMEVLAETSPSLKFKHPHPSVFIVRHPKARIAGITPGHDERAHDLPEYKKLLINAVNWVAGK